MTAFTLGRGNQATALHLYAILIVGGCLLLAVGSRPIEFLDDAWITFRYARNLAFAGELTFNPGERVEGITNMLWALLLALEMRLLPLAVVPLAAVTGLSLTAVALQRMWKLGVALGLHPLVSTIAPSVLILTPDFYATMTNGLEGPLFAVLLSEALLRIVRGEAVSTAIALGLLFMSRPEALSVGLMYVLLLARPSVRLDGRHRLTLEIYDLRSFGRRVSFTRAAAILTSFVVAVTAFRLNYFGAILPNSMQAKIYPFSRIILEGGVAYFVEFASSNPHLVLIVLIAFSLAVHNAQSRPSRDEAIAAVASDATALATQLALFCILYSFLVVIRSGGDWMPASRLLLQYGPAYAAALALGLGRLAAYTSLRLPLDRGVSELTRSSSRPAARTHALPVMLGLAIALLPAQRTLVADLARRQEHTRFLELRASPGFPFWNEVAARLSAAPLTDSDRVSSEGIGYIAYELRETRMHDPLGLTDAHIAREGKERYPFGKLDLEYSLWSVRPSVMIWHYAGQLRKYDAEAIDQAYVTYCFALCDSWSADIAMIRRDRAGILGPLFEDWQSLTFTELYALNP